MYGQAGLLPAIVASTGADGSATVVLANRSEIVLPAGAAKWTNKTPGKLVQRGDIVRVRAGAKEGEWLLDQIRAASPRWSRWMPTAAR
jgi:penicillin-binding protein 1A